MSEFAEKKSAWDGYVVKPASKQNAMDVFSDRWTTNFTPLGFTNTGTTNLVNDIRLRWLTGVCEIQGLKVLELGSFEGAHTEFYSRRCRSVLGIEAHTQHFMKSLVLKNNLALDNVTFLLGDFETFLENDTEEYDLVSAIGVLYHMKNPVKIIDLCSRAARRLVIWTVIYDEQVIPDGHRSRISGPIQFETPISYSGYKHFYQEEGALELNKKGKFSGGTDNYAIWLTKDTLLRAIESLGYRVVSEVTNSVPNHRHGRNILLYAERPA